MNRPAKIFFAGFIMLAGLASLVGFAFSARAEGRSATPAIPAATAQWTMQPNSLYATQLENQNILIKGCDLDGCLPIGREAGYSRDELAFLLRIVRNSRVVLPLVKGSCMALSVAVIPVTHIMAGIPLLVFCMDGRFNQQAYEEVEGVLGSLVQGQIGAQPFQIRAESLVAIKKALPALLDNLEFNESAISGP